MNFTIPDIKVPIIKNNSSKVVSIVEEFRNKKIILFGIPGSGFKIFEFPAGNSKLIQTICECVVRIPRKSQVASLPNES